MSKFSRKRVLRDIWKHNSHHQSPSKRAIFCPILSLPKTVNQTQALNLCEGLQFSLELPDQESSMPRNGRDRPPPNPPTHPARRLRGGSTSLTYRVLWKTPQLVLVRFVRRPVHHHAHAFYHTCQSRTRSVQSIMKSPHGFTKQCEASISFLPLTT